MRAGRAERRAIVTAGCLVVLAVTACTSPPPEPEAEPAPLEEPAAGQPSLGAVVGLVLPATTEVDAGVRRAIEADVSRLAATLGPEVRDVRTVSPDDQAFAGDLMAMLADQGTDLVCVVGETSPSGLTRLADLHPDLRFCATTDSAQLGRPGQPELVEVRAAELGHVVGSAALAAAGPEGVVGVVLGGDDVPAAAFRSGVLAGLGDIEVVEEELDEGLPEGMEQVLEAGATVVVVDGAEGAAEAVAAAVGQALVLAPTSVIGPAGNATVLSWRVRWDLVLRRPVAGLLGWADRGPTSFGFREDAFGVVLRPGASAAVRERVEAVIAELEAGAVDPVEPPEEPVVGTTPSPDPDETDEVVEDPAS